MRAKETMRIIGGSALVYVAVATCQIAGGGKTDRQDGGRRDVAVTTSQAGSGG